MQPTRKVIHGEKNAKHRDDFTRPAVRRRLWSHCTQRLCTEGLRDATNLLFKKNFVSSSLSNSLSHI